MQEYRDPNAGPPLYRVTHVDDSTMLGTRGGFQRSKKVFYVTSGGAESYVELPLADFNRANVDALITQHLTDLLGVLALEGPPVPPTPG